MHVVTYQFTCRYTAATLPLQCRCVAAATDLLKLPTSLHAATLPLRCRPPCCYAAVAKRPRTWAVAQDLGNISFSKSTGF